MRESEFIAVSDTSWFSRALQLIGLRYRPFKKCAAFEGMFDAEKAKACKPARGILVEPTGNGDDVEIPKLPGCNPLCQSSRRISVKLIAELAACRGGWTEADVQSSCCAPRR